MVVRGRACGGVGGGACVAGVFVRVEGCEQRAHHHPHPSPEPTTTFPTPTHLCVQLSQFPSNPPPPNLTYTVSLFPLVLS